MAGLRRFFVLYALLVLQASLLQCSDEKGLGGVVVTVLSQGDAYHSARARDKRERWLEQLSTPELQSAYPSVLLAHELPVKGATWTIVPLLSYLAEQYPEEEWFFFVNEETEVNFKVLRAVLKRYNKNKAWFLGHALKDQTATIIHHYMDHTGSEAIHYPNFASGWALSQPALQRAAESAVKFSPNFNIDPQFELALFLKYMRTPKLTELLQSPPAAENGGVLLTNVTELCMQRRITLPCATAYTHDIPHCEGVETEVFIGVKTCQKFHSTRLPVVQGTWAPDAEGSIAYYSEVEDEEFHTTDLGVPNTESGHCGKMMAIISRFQNSQGGDWLVIADDDTLLSVPRLHRLLACYLPDSPILLGEAYGYNAQNRMGYTYITGGGSMVLSRAAVDLITGSGQQCPTDSTPDDMFLGNLAKNLGISIIHSPLFHQAQPSTFHPEVLRLQTPVSFHRHRPADPYFIYREYLTDSNQQRPVPNTTTASKTKKTEL